MASAVKFKVTWKLYLENRLGIGGMEEGGVLEFLEIGELLKMEGLPLKWGSLNPSMNYDGRTEGRTDPNS